MNRRTFLVGWLFQPKPTERLVEVMEVFSTRDGPSALLVHHVNEATRYAFAEWLRANNGTKVALRLRDGTRFDGRIFRVNLCFGRGLILLRAPVAIHRKEVVTIH